LIEYRLERVVAEVAAADLAVFDRANELAGRLLLGFAAHARYELQVANGDLVNVWRHLVWQAECVSPS
jgi:hypothetical protein